MRIFNLLVLLNLALFSTNTFANIEVFADDIVEARVLVDSRNYLKEVRLELNRAGSLSQELSQELLELEEILEVIAKNGCDCPAENNLIRGQAYALIGAINGVLSKETKSLALGKKSYQSLARARELDPRNIDAIRGQGEALKAILKEGMIVRGIVSVTLGLNLKRERKNLIRDLRTFGNNTILQRLADQLSKFR
ncbi:MAG: hypothetical protein NXH75_05100 [Halobacteriovoraceae bacterium]|nr:hypothetical protein [Halobacteriovoraceae bacterium]